MAAPGITIIFSFTYRTQTEEWSQQYHLDSDFTGLTDFNTTADALRTALKPTLPSATTFERAYGYHDTDDNAAFTRNWRDLSDLQTGTLSPTTGVKCPGDAAATVRWLTARVNSRGRKIYLRKYFHDVLYTPGEADHDALSGDQSGPLNTFATNAITTGWSGHKLAGPDGVIPTTPVVSPWITTRTLRRRGRRPPPP